MLVVWCENGLVSADVQLTQHDTADVVDTLGDAVLAPAHSDASLRAARQSVARNLTICIT